MGSGDHSESIGVIKLLRNIVAENVPGTSGRDTPAIPVFRIGPKQVAHGALMWHLLETVEHTDVIKGFDRGGQASVQAENL